MKVYYYTFGCKVNQYETENIKEHMDNNGFSSEQNYKDADIAIINTCTVTSRSDLKCRQLLHKLRRENPDMIIVLTGCFPQAFTEQAESFTECDIVTGSANKSRIPDYIDEYLVHRQRIINIPPHTKGEKFEKMTNNNNTDKTRAYIKIQDGCDQYCSYCIIPYARGHIRSKSLDDIAKEAEMLADSDHKEIIAVGINLCCYGKDFNDGTRLADAVELICKTVGSKCRVRLGSIEPEMISDEDIIKLSELDNFCPQFHLSLQSGCDKTLKEMNRKYTTSEYKLLCDKLRKHFKDCAITTDVMVGFAGETDEDFKKSLEFVRRIGFSKVHIFPYSKREGTAAAKRTDQIPKKVKQERAEAMAKICSVQRKEFLENMVGKTFPVLFEKESSADYHQGYTPNYTPVKVPRISADVTLRKQVLNVKITGSADDYCFGEIAERNESNEQK
ncbi:MAG: tRNA (N(6)-L-threonylcarbamoyladenosine(37)-C(2))-methylthiotransferase MtaB [Oscillospiraceae bacterium]